MSKLSLVSWNVNGVRAAERKGFVDWLKNLPASRQGGEHDVVCLQETKLTDPSQLSEAVLHVDDYESYWSCSKVKKGYSGVAIYTKAKPLEVRYGMGEPEFDDEGRFIEARYQNFILINVYFPNGGGGPVRLDYKLRFYDHFLKYIEKLKRKGERIIFCGDINTAHEAIDLARPKENEKNTGFLPEERAWLDEVVAAGWIDTFRHFQPHKTDVYSYWDIKTAARDRNVGWRIDYFFLSPNFLSNLKTAFILPDIYGSDHCPVGITIEV